MPASFDTHDQPTSAYGLGMFRSLDLDETEEEVTQRSCTVYGWFIFNNAAALRYVKFYNGTQGAVVVGTTTPVLTLPIPAGQALNLFGGVGVYFSDSLSLAATTGVADNDTGAPAANDVIVNLFYRD